MNYNSVKLYVAYFPDYSLRDVQKKVFQNVLEDARNIGDVYSVKSASAILDQLKKINYL